MRKKWVGLSMQHISRPENSRDAGIIDRQKVVDAQLRVRGIEKLRVIDASVMPAITSGNTNSPTLMIAGDGAMLMRGTRA